MWGWPFLFFVEVGNVGLCSSSSPEVKWCCVRSASGVVMSRELSQVVKSGGTFHNPSVTVHGGCQVVKSVDFDPSSK